MKVNFTLDKTTDSKEGSGPTLFKSWNALARLCLGDVGINVGKREAKSINVNEKGVYIVFGDKRGHTPDACPYCNGPLKRKFGEKMSKASFAYCLNCGKTTV
jgi:hypothetical protein